MKSSSQCLQKGHVYYFYRPKTEHTKARTMDDVQRFFMILRPADEKDYILLIVGQKRMPEASPYFAFVDKVANSTQLIKSLGEYQYDTKTRGKKTNSFARCVGKGKYLIAEHKNHIHFLYQLEAPSNPGEIQKEFHVKTSGDFLLSVKNPETKTSSKGVGLIGKQKAKFPDELQEKFKGQNFIPLTPTQFLNYEVAELLFIGQEKQNLLEQEQQLSACLSKLPEDTFMQEFVQMEPPQSLEPMKQKKWQ